MTVSVGSWACQTAEVNTAKTRRARRPAGKPAGLPEQDPAVVSHLSGHWSRTAVAQVRHSQIRRTVTPSQRNGCPGP